MPVCRDRYVSHQSYSRIKGDSCTKQAHFRSTALGKVSIIVSQVGQWNKFSRTNCTYVPYRCILPARPLHYPSTSATDKNTYRRRFILTITYVPLHVIVTVAEYVVDASKYTSPYSERSISKYTLAGENVLG